MKMKENKKKEEEEKKKRRRNLQTFSWPELQSHNVIAHGQLVTVHLILKPPCPLHSHSIYATAKTEVLFLHTAQDLAHKQFACSDAQTFDPCLLGWKPCEVNIELAVLHCQLSKALLHSSLQLPTSFSPPRAQLQGSFQELPLLCCHLLLYLFLLTYRKQPHAISSQHAVNCMLNSACGEDPQVRTPNMFAYKLQCGINHSLYLFNNQNLPTLG